MRIAVQIFAGLMLAVAALVVRIALRGGTGTKVIGLGLASVIVAGAVGVFVLAWRYPRLVEAGAKRGETVMPLGKMVASFGALGVMWLYNLAILAVLIVLTIRLV